MLERDGDSFGEVQVAAPVRAQFGGPLQVHAHEGLEGLGRHVEELLKGVPGRVAALAGDALDDPR